MTEKKLAEMLMMAIEDEIHDREHYKRLIHKVSDRDDKEILRQISLDEQKHERIFTDIYTKVTGKKPHVTNKKEHEPSDNILSDFEKSIFDETEAVEFYRQIYFSFLDLETRDMLYEVITDEQNHAVKLTYLYSKYRKF